MRADVMCISCFFFNDTATTEIYTLSLHDALPIWIEVPAGVNQQLHSDEEAEQVYIVVRGRGAMSVAGDTQELDQGDLVLVPRSEEHTSELQSRQYLVCRLLLEKKKKLQSELLSYI